MKALNGFAALSLSLILGLVPFALIAVNDIAVARAGIFTTVADTAGHALGTEGR